MKEVIYYRCEYCAKDFDDKDTCSRHEKAEAKKYKNIDTILSLRKRDLKDKSLYYKFFEGDMTDTSFNICPADVLQRDVLSLISQKSLATYAKKIDAYKTSNTDVTCELCHIYLQNNTISFYFEGRYYPLEQYESSFRDSRLVDFSIYRNGSYTIVEFRGVKNTELYKKIRDKLTKIIAETKLVSDDTGCYKIDYIAKIVSSTHSPNWSESSILRTRKFEAL